MRLDLRSRSFGTRPVLGALVLEVAAGERVALLGPSGIGKTTLARIVAGLDRDFDGTLEVPERLAMVFQEPTLLPWRDTLGNVMLPLELRGDAGAREKATEMLGRVGLSSRLKHYPKFLSGGEQQRVALARAFVTEPPLLFADEPTGSLDAATGEAVIQLMFELNRERGSTLVLVTHDPAMAARCGRTLTIAAGRLQA